MARGLAEKKEKKARESRLQLAIANDDVDELHHLIVEEPELLDRISKHPFPTTPLHMAAAAGKTDVAMELAILKPSFARKLDPEGHSPMHLALQCEHYDTVRALMTVDHKLIRVQGRCGITPLHYVAKKEGENELLLLAEFLCACKSSIKDLTSRCETAVHVAIKNHNLEAFKVLFGWIRRVELSEILNWKDRDGNTILHIAVSEYQPKIIKLLIWHVKIDEKNSGNKTALEIFQENPSRDRNLEKRLRCREYLVGLLPFNYSLPKFLSMKPSVFEKIESWFGLQDDSARNIILLVATLITTASYQAALTPPGGYWQDDSSNLLVNSTVVTANSTACTTNSTAITTNSSRIAVEKPHQAGNIIMNNSKLNNFTVSNNIVFMASIFTIWISAVPLLPRTLPVYLLMAVLGCAFLSTATVEFPKSDEAAANFITVFCTILLIVALAIPLDLWLMYKCSLRGASATGKRIGNFLELKYQK